MKTREKWIDYLKGVLIILVVLGHILPPPYAVLVTPASYIFLFHMPAFFIISGYLVKTDKPLLSSIWGKTKRILGPYFFYLFLIAGTQVLMAYIKNPRMIYFKKNFTKFIMGGQDLNYFTCGALWFLTCSFFIYVFFFVIEKLPKVWMRGIAYLVMWGIAHYQSLCMESKATFWLWDVAIIGCVYLAIGKYFKKYIFDKRVLIGAIVCVAGVLGVHALHIIPYLDNFGIELWSHTYRYPVLDFIIPCGIFVILANLTKLIPEGKVSGILADLGKYSLAIMAMHQMVIKLMIEKCNITNVFLLTIIATVIPYLIVKFIWAKIPGIRRISY